MPKDIEVEIFLKGGKTFIRDVKKTGKAVEKAGDGFSKGQKNLVSFAAALSIVTTAARGALRVVGVLQDIGAAALQTGSDFEEANQKFGVVFAGVATESREMREELTKNFGLSSLAATELLSRTGDLLTGFGFTDKAALELSGTVSKLAVDIASFSNVQGGAERVNRIITKSLLGEREGLKELGIAVLEADVKNRILEKGQQDLTGATLRQAKAVATLELAYEQSAKAIGDFERTSGSLANQQRILDNSFEDLQTSIGLVLIPITQEFLGQLIKLTDQTDEWVEANKNLIAGDLAEFAKFTAASITLAGQAALFTAKTMLSLKGASAIVGEGFINLSIDATRSLAFILDGVAILGRELTQTFSLSIQGIKRLFLDLAKSTAEIILSGEDFLPDSVVAGVKGNLSVIKAALQDSTNLDTSGENVFSEVLKGTSAVLKENITLLETRKQKAIDDQVETANQIQSINDLSESLLSLNSNIQDGLNGVKEAADRGELFSQTLASIQAETDAERLAAAERKEIAFEEQEAKREAISAFNEFRSTSEEGQLEKAFQRRRLSLEGLEIELQTDIELREDQAKLRLEIEQTHNQAVFDIQESFRNKNADAEKAKADAATALERRRNQEKLRATSQLFGGLAALSQSLGEENFKRTKALRIGEAIINTYAGAARALASDIPYPYNLVAAASVIANGLASVNTIRQQQPVRAQHGLAKVQKAEQPALLHLGESVLTREETGNFNQFLTDLEEGGGQTAPGGGVNVTLQIENMTLMADDDEAIGNLTTAIRRQLEEQNLVAIQ